MTLPQTLPERLQWAREAAGLKRRTLSDLAGISHYHVDLIEQGTRKSPQFETLAKLADVLGVSLDWLCRGGPMPTKTAIRAAVAIRLEAREQTGTG